MQLGLESHGKPPNDFKQGSYMSGIAFYKDHSGHSVKNTSEGGKTESWVTYQANNNTSDNNSCQ